MINLIAMDMGLSIGFFAIFALFGSLNYATIFSLSPFMNETAITIIAILLLSGAMAKSSQIPLHSWLPGSMEGPTPVSALIHAATLVTKQVQQLPLNSVNYLIINSLYAGITIIWVYIYIKFYLIEIYKKILNEIDNSINLMVNQQITFNILNGNSETTCELTFNNELNNNLFNFSEYFKFKPQHKSKVDQDFLEWFIGFTEGDGSFIVTNNKVKFDITQIKNDVQVLYYIKTNLGFGKVYIRKEIERNIGYFYITKKDNFKRLIKIFNGNICTEYKHNQFKKWVETYNKQYKDNIKVLARRPLPSLKNAWLAGFTDAEGSFLARIKSSKTTKSGLALVLTYQISQKDSEILYKIKSLFKLYDISNKNITFDKSWEGWRLQLDSFKVLRLVKLYFNKYNLKTKKHIRYLVWCKILNMGLIKKHLTEKGLDIIKNYINKMNKKKLKI